MYCNNLTPDKWFLKQPAAHQFVVQLQPNAFTVLREILYKDTFYQTTTLFYFRFKMTAVYLKLATSINALL